MSYDEPDYEPQPEPNRDPIKIAVDTEISFGEVLDRIAWKAIEAFRERYESDNGSGRIARVISATIAKAVEKRAMAAAEQRVDEAVEKILTEGWQSTNEFGEPKDQVTLATIVRKQLTSKQRAPRYDSPERTAVELKVDAYIDGFVARAMEEELKAARERFRKAVDVLIEQKVLEAARAALKGG